MEIKCDFRRASYTYDYDYGCFITEANITEKKHVIKEFLGTHNERKNHDDVKYVEFEGAVDHFPRGLHKHFPNLTTLIIKKSDIKEISKNDLKGLERLVILEIDECKLTSLPDDLLTKMPRLKEFSITRNKIEFASSKLLEPLIGRQDVKVSLWYNKKTHACFWPNCPGTVESLEELMEKIDEECIKPTAVTDPVDSNPIIKEMWISGRFSDINIIAGDRKFKAHKNVLGVQSVVFAQIFEDQADATEIKIPDFPSKAVEALLKFIYTTEVPNDENIKENFEIAGKFKVVDMISKCEEIIIIHKLDESNAWENFLIAHRFSTQLLKEEAFDRINRTFNEEIPKRLPKKLMDDPEKLKKFLDLQREMKNLLEE